MVIWEVPARVQSGMEHADLKALIAKADADVKAANYSDEELEAEMQKARIASSADYQTILAAQAAYQTPSQRYFALERVINRRTLARLHPDAPIAN